MTESVERKRGGKKERKEEKQFKVLIKGEISVLWQ